MRASGLFMVALRITLAVLALFITVLAALRAWGSGDPLVYVATQGDVIDILTILSVLDVLLAVIGVMGAWLFLWRKRLGLVAAFLLLPFPAPFIIEANRCDYLPLCESTDWALLPRQAFVWSIRIRDVDVHAAQDIANGALRSAHLPYSAWYPRLDARQWRVETRNQDMERGPYDVIVDAETGRASIVRR